MEFVEYPDTDMMFLSLAQMLSRELRNALTRRERALIALPGGTTPGPLLDLLSAAEVDWDRVDIIPGDERCVPPDHPRSNAGLIRARLLRGKAAAARLIPLWQADSTPAQTAATLEPLLPIDIALLGMGIDMHTASLFPGADALAAALATDAPVLVPISAPGGSEPRVTLSARVLRDAFAIHLLIAGAEKRAALDRALKLPPIEAPVSAVLANATVHWAP